MTSVNSSRSVNLEAFGIDPDADYILSKGQEVSLDGVLPVDNFFGGTLVSSGDQDPLKTISCMHNDMSKGKARQVATMVAESYHQPLQLINSDPSTLELNRRERPRLY